jgi:hypothetical protein
MAPNTMDMTQSRYQQAAENLYFDILDFADECGFTFEEAMEAIIAGHQKYLDAKEKKNG